MKTLALEFSSSQRSVAVAVDGFHLREVIEAAPARTMHPFAMIRSALEQAGVARDQVDRIVVGLGPGSYTGIRAAIAMARGWQLAREVALLGVSSVEAMAAQAQADGVRGQVHFVVDAQRGEFYLAVWELSDAGRREVSPLTIVNRDKVNACVDDGAIIAGPDATRWFPSARAVFPRASALAQIAFTQTAPGAGAQLEPIYLRETTFVKAPPPRSDVGS
jgi:tRNA threonylcarbamoyladenosine biosynthesis protein TsaB